MKKNKLMSLALLGISAVSLVTNGCGKASGDDMTPEMKSFYEQLTPEAQQKFLQLDTEHKKMAVNFANQYCKGESQCGGHREQEVEKLYKQQMQQRQKLNQNMK